MFSAGEVRICFLFYMYLQSKHTFVLLVIHLHSLHLSFPACKCFESHHCDVWDLLDFCFLNMKVHHFKHWWVVLPLPLVSGDLNPSMLSSTSQSLFFENKLFSLQVFVWFLRLVLLLLSHFNLLWTNNIQKNTLVILYFQGLHCGLKHVHF